MLAVSNLERQGYITFCPMISRHVRHARKTQLKPSPLFPSYLFTRFDISQVRWRPIASTPGIVSIVKTGNTPTPLPRGLIESLQSASSAAGLVQQIGPAARVGDNVRVVGGTFDDWLGHVVALPAQDRITVLLEAATRKVELTLDAGQVLPVSSPASPPVSPRARMGALA